MSRYEIYHKIKLLVIFALEIEKCKEFNSNSDSTSSSTPKYENEIRQSSTAAKEEQKTSAEKIEDVWVSQFKKDYLKSSTQKYENDVKNMKNSIAAKMEPKISVEKIEEKTVEKISDEKIPEKISDDKSQTSKSILEQDIPFCTIPTFIIIGAHKDKV